MVKESFFLDNSNALLLVSEENHVTNIDASPSLDAR
jgi:hypothetical protein